MSNAPHYEIDVPRFWADPYPDLAVMRKDAPIAFVPQLGSTIFTRRDDIFSQEKRIDVLSADANPPSGKPLAERYPVAAGCGAANPDETCVDELEDCREMPPRP